MGYMNTAEVNTSKVLWEKGDFTRIAASTRESGAELVAGLGIQPGMRVLDLGCGDGTTAIPAAELGATVLGVDIASNLVEAGSARARSRGLRNVTFAVGDANNLDAIADGTFDWVVSIFGAMFATPPAKVAHEMVRVTRPGGRIVMGNWIPDDPTLVAQIFRICSDYTPPPAGSVSPMTWGDAEFVRRRFMTAGISEGNIHCEKATYRFRTGASPRELLITFRDYYGPMMNAFQSAAAAGSAEQLMEELSHLFHQQNRSPKHTDIPATYLKVTVTKDRC